MKASGYLFLAILISILSISACSRKTTPAFVSSKIGKNFDAAAFNYVYVEAIKQKLMGNGGDALKYFEQCVGINPESDASYYQMAQIVIINGDLKNGKSYALKAHSIDSTNIWYLMILAGIYYQEKNIDSAIVCYENAVKSYPEKENLKLALGNLYSENKSYEKANSVFRELDVAGSVNENIKLAAVKNLITAGRFSEALSKTKELLAINPEEIVYSGLLAEIYSALGEKDKALEVYKALMEKNPDNSQTQLSLCDFLITEKSYDELFNLLNTINFNSGITREEKISIYVRLLEIPSFVKERGDELIVTLMVLEATYKDDKVIPLLMPDLFIKQDRMQDASERLEEIVKVTPQNYYAWEKLLFIYLQMKDYKKLESRGEECASLFNTSFVVKILYANGAAENSQFEIALGELKKAEILAGENKEYIMQVLTMRADIYYRMKDYDKAFKLFEEAIKTDNSDYTILNNYAYYLAEQNMNLKEAEEMAKRVIDNEKGNTTYLDTYGWILFKRGKFSEAAKVMESIIGSGETPEAVWYEHYGFILKEQKRCEEAIKNWNIAKELDSSKAYLIKEIENCGG